MVKKFILISLILLISINLVLASSCSDTDQKRDSKPGGKFYSSWGMIYNTAGVTSGVDKSGKSFSKEDYCQDKKILSEYYCYYSREQYYLGEAKYVCPNGCNSKLKICNPKNNILGKVIDLSSINNSTGVFLQIGIIILVAAVFILVFFKNNKKVKKKRR